MQVGNELSNILSKSLHARKKPQAPLMQTAQNKYLQICLCQEQLLVENHKGPKPPSNNCGNSEKKEKKNAENPSSWTKWEPNKFRKSKRQIILNREETANETTAMTITVSRITQQGSQYQRVNLQPHVALSAIVSH